MVQICYVFFFRIDQILDEITKTRDRKLSLVFKLMGKFNEAVLFRSYRRQEIKEEVEVNEISSNYLLKKMKGKFTKIIGRHFLKEEEITAKGSS